MESAGATRSLGPGPHPHPRPQRVPGLRLLVRPLWLMPTCRAAGKRRPPPSAPRTRDGAWDRAREDGIPPCLADPLCQEGYQGGAPGRRGPLPGLRRPSTRCWLPGCGSDRRLPGAEGRAGWAPHPAGLSPSAGRGLTAALLRGAQRSHTSPRSLRCALASGQAPVSSIGGPVPGRGRGRRGSPRLSSGEPQPLTLGAPVPWSQGEGRRPWPSRASLWQAGPDGQRHLRQARAARVGVSLAQALPSVLTVAWARGQRPATPHTPALPLTPPGQSLLPTGSSSRRWAPTLTPKDSGCWVGVQAALLGLLLVSREFRNHEPCQAWDGSNSQGAAPRGVCTARPVYAAAAALRPGRALPLGRSPPQSSCSSRLPQARLCPAGFRFVSSGDWGRTPGQTVARQGDGRGPEPETPSPWARRPGHRCLPGPAARLPFATPPHGAGSPGPPARLPVLGTRTASRTDGGRPAGRPHLVLGADGGAGAAQGSEGGIRRGGPQVPAPLPPARRPAPGTGDPTAHLAAPIPSFPCFLGPADTTRGCEVVDRPWEPGVGGAVGPEVQASVLVRLLSAQPPPW